MRQADATPACGQWCGDRLLEVRVILDVKQKELAEQAGLTVERVKLLERGKKIPSADELARICKALRVPDWFLSTPATRAREKIRAAVATRAARRRAKVNNLVRAARREALS